MRSLFLLLLAGILGACSSSETATAPDPDRPPNLVILFADDMGYGDLSSYGHPTIQTPHLDRMADEGIKMTSFYVASPVCSPSRASLLTGRYPTRAGMPHVLGPDSDRGLAASEVTLAEALKAQGYATAAFGKWHLGSRPGGMPTDHGFDVYAGLLYSNDMMPPWVQTERPLRYWENETATDEYPVDQTTLTDRATARAIAFIDEHEDQPFFLYVPYSMPHVPVFATAPFMDAAGGDTYRAVIEELDASVGRILDALRQRGLDRNTLVVFSSDNGPWLNMPERMFGEDKVKPWDAGSPGPLRGHKGTTYEGGVRVPGIAWWPGRIPAGQVSGELMTTMDLLPTFLTRIGAPMPSGVTLDGTDAWAVLQGGASPHERFYYTRGERLEAVREGPWKLRTVTGEPELFNLLLDPSERYNLAADYPDRVERLQELMAGAAPEIGAVLE